MEDEYFYQIFVNYTYRDTSNDNNTSYFTLLQIVVPGPSQGSTTTLLKKSAPFVYFEDFSEKVEKDFKKKLPSSEFCITKWKVIEMRKEDYYAINNGTYVTK